MKKIKALLLGVPLSLALFACAGCGANAENTADVPPQTETVIPQTPIIQEDGVKPTKPAVSRFAALDGIDANSAFGGENEEDWSFGLRLGADFGTAVQVRWYSEAEDCERFYAMAGASLSAEDTLGLRKNDEGIKLFGGGSISLSAKGAAPSSDSPVKEKTLEAGIYHDGDWTVFANAADGSETRVDMWELGTYVSELCADETLARIAETAEIIPQSLAQGELRLGVEKLVSLGFKAEVEEENGICVRLSADVGLFTDWFNDSLEEILPEVVLKYLPRLDLRYTSAVFDITLAFDEAGMFEEYTLKSDVALETELRVRGLFSLTGGYEVKGAFSLTAADAALPEQGETL